VRNEMQAGEILLTLKTVCSEAVKSEERDASS
jgi:hypothetical protein